MTRSVNRGGDGRGVGGRRAARVVHEHVEMTEPFDDRVDGRPRRLAVTQVGGEERPVVGQVVDLLAGAHRDRGAGVGESLRDAAAHSAGAAGDQHHLAARSRARPSSAVRYRRWEALDGKVAVVTGASKGGIGTGIAERFAAEGAKVAVAARTRAGLEEALALVEAAGSSGGVYVVDLSRPDGGRDTLIADVERDLGPVDVMVNNSAFGGYKPFEEWTLAQLQKVQEVNNWSAWLFAQHVLPGMRERGHGAILNISSRSAEIPPGPPFPHTAPARAGSAYGSTKAMLDRWTASLAVETHGQGIQVNALSPQRAAATATLVGQRVVPADLLRAARHDGRSRARAGRGRPRHAHRPRRAQPRPARRARPPGLRPARREPGRRLAAGRPPRRSSPRRTPRA